MGVRLSICIPTYNRAWVLAEALEAAARERQSQPEGLVEILVSDNASPDATPAVLDGLERRFGFRRQRHPVNVGAQQNFLSLVEQARGEFIWLMGDDDQVRPGSAGRLLRALDAGVDLCLFGAMECDRHLRPLEARTWFREELPESEWLIDSPRALGDYLDRCRYLAGAFAFISAMAFRRDRFLACRDSYELGIHTGFPHAWAMQAYLRQPTRLHWLPEPLFNNRLGTDEPELFWRLMLDVDSWILLADHFHRDDPELRAKLLAVVRRNQMDRQVGGLRLHSTGDPGKWERARGQLLRLGYPACLVNTVEFAHRVFYQGFPPNPGLDPEALCLCSLATLARGARRIAVIAPGGAPGCPDLATLLAALREQGGAGRIRVVCPPGAIAPSPGLEVQEVDRERLRSDPGGLGAEAAALRAFAPELAVHADPDPDWVGAFLTGAAQAAGSLAFRPAPERPADPLQPVFPPPAHNLLLEPEPAWGAGLCRALGLTVPAAQEA